jgi:fused signal recognition particle receptor
VGLWSRLRELALADVGALVRGSGGAQLAAFELLLLEADLGPAAAQQLVDEVTAALRRGELRGAAEVRTVLEHRLTTMLSAGASTDPGQIARAATGPTVVLLVGVNGVGKTTVAARLGGRLKAEGRAVLLCAADTWRAGAVRQLDEWATRLDLPCVRGQSGQDPAAVVFDALEAALARGLDTVIVDTAGRLHTHGDLMKELQKLARVAARRVPGSPHETLLVVDGSTGLNAVQQGKVFAAALPLTGIVVTKLDGTGRGGALVPLLGETGVPARFIGTGEEVSDLEVFEAAAHARRLLDG